MTKLSRLRGSEGYAVRANSRVNKLKASRFQFERRGNGANAVFAKRRSLAAETETSAVCPDDEGAYWFRRGCGDWNSGRMRLTSLKRAPIN